MSIDDVGLEHHALLIAWMAQATLQRFPEQGPAVIREGVHRYGEERGRHMAATARAAGRPLDLVSVLVFGEIDTSGNVWQMAQLTPFLEMHALKCGWHAVWQKNDLLETGSLYCLEVDDAILHGFNPDFDFGVDGTLSNGAPFCRFLYRGGKLDLPNRLRLAWEKRRAGIKYKRPFAFHVLHYFRTMSRTLRDAFGRDGEDISADCARHFNDHFGISMEEIESRWGEYL